MGVMTLTPGLARSSQSLMPFGLPFRTTSTMVEVYGDALCGSFFCHSAVSQPPCFARASVSPASASVATSASRPSMIERACLPEPPCDCLIVTSCPVLAFQYFENAGLNSANSSRVGSYDTFSSVSCRANDGRAGRDKTAATVAASGILIKSRRRRMELPIVVGIDAGILEAAASNWNDRVVSYLFP